MKTKKATIEAQAICLEAATEVFEELVKVLTDLEEDKFFSEEPSLALRPYNNGYRIEIEAPLNWDNPMAADLPSLFYSPFIQPNTFFEDYIVNDTRNARMEYGLLMNNDAGYTSGQMKTSCMNTFRVAAEAWVEVMKKQISKLDF